MSFPKVSLAFVWFVDRKGAIDGVMSCQVAAVAQVRNDGGGGDRRRKYSYWGDNLEVDISLVIIWKWEVREWEPWGLAFLPGFLVPGKQMDRWYHWLRSAHSVGKRRVQFGIC